MKILMVTPEASPFAKVGGLGDVVGALPKALKKLGHDVRIVLPLYACIQNRERFTPHHNPLQVHLGYGIEYARIWESPLPGSEATVYFVEFNKYFDRHEIYTGPWGDHKDNPQRFTFLSRAALDLCHYLNWIPDVIHAHDWPTGLVPVYLNTKERDQPLGQTASVFTIHNMEHQGHCHKDVLDFAGLPRSVFKQDGLECMGLVNMMKGALYHSTKITTVSPHYAQEIQTPEFGCGLNPALKYKAGDLIGILNGIDTDVWDPATDTKIPENFSATQLSGKALCKARLQKRMGLKVNPYQPVFGVVSRLYLQKGLHLLADILDRLMATMEIQIVLLGSGDHAQEHDFSYFASIYPGRVGTHIGYSDELSHLVVAGSDFFIMPSMFEPCGLSQLYAMRYGCLPIVRRTGGLVDTVQQYNEETGEGTGFIFDEPSSHALYYAIGWACATYYDRPDVYQKLQNQAMSQDFSWDQSAKRYEDVYRWAVGGR